MTQTRSPRGLEGPLRSVLRATQSGLSDEQLLERIANSHDEAAFECLVWRHGPMVLGTCRRLLGHAHDADDAFQATFLVLFRRVTDVNPRSRVGAWLHGVAVRVCARLKLANARRWHRERAAARPAVAPADRAEAAECAELLDLELARLPEKNRLPIVLCELQGLTIQEAAVQLGWPVGTVASRLARGRSQLARQLRNDNLVSGLPVPLVETLPSDLVGRTVTGTVGEVSPLVQSVATAVGSSMGVWKMSVTLVVFALVLFTGVGAMGILARGKGAAQVPVVNRATEENLPVPDARPKFIAWGKAEDGLQVGISYPPGVGHEFRLGDVFPLQVHLKNTTDKEIEYSLVDRPRTLPFTSVVLPRILDTALVGGRAYQLKVTGIPHDPGSEPSKYKLAAGATVLLGEPRFSIGNTVKGAATIQGRPGSYNLGFASTPINGNQKHDRYPSGDLRFVILPVIQPIAWGKVEKIQLGVVAEPTSPRIGERVTFRLFARNMAGKPMAFKSPNLDFHYSFARPIVLDEKGKAAKLHFLVVPGVPPELRYQNWYIPEDAIVEVGTTTWQLRGPKWDIVRDPAKPAILLESGKYTVRFADMELKDAPRCDSGTITLTVGKAEEEHTDREGVTWGKVSSDGAQFGLRLQTPREGFWQSGDMLRFEVLFRNLGEKELTLKLADPLFAQAGEPFVTDAAGNPCPVIRVTRPGQPEMKKYTAQPGEVTSVFQRSYALWPKVVAQAPPTVPGVIGVDPGVCTIRFEKLGMLGDTNESPGWVTGPVRFEVRQGKPGAARRLIPRDSPW